MPSILLLIAMSRLVSMLVLHNLTLPTIPTPINLGITATNGMSIQDWANAARRSPYRQSYEQQRAIDTLEIVFEW